LASGVTASSLTSVGTLGGLSVTGGVTVGVDDTGHDVKFFGAAAGSHMLWDEDENRLDVVASSGAAYIRSLNGTATTYIGSDGSNTALFGTTTAHDVRFITNDAERFRIDTTGLITSPRSYSATTGNSANLVVYDSGGGFYRSTSSRKYKTDIEDMQDSWADKILGLRPVWYRSTCEPDNKDWSYWGLIAEEVEDVDPRLVHHDEDGTPEGVQYDRIVPHLINLIKRLQTRVATLEGG